MLFVLNKIDIELILLVFSFAFHFVKIFTISMSHS
jgi:hypothetical protein